MTANANAPIPLQPSHVLLPPLAFTPPDPACVGVTVATVVVVVVADPDEGEPDCDAASPCNA